MSELSVAVDHHDITVSKPSVGLSVTITDKGASSKQSGPCGLTQALRN